MEYTDGERPTRNIKNVMVFKFLRSYLSGKIKATAEHERLTPLMSELRVAVNNTPATSAANSV